MRIGGVPEHFNLPWHLSIAKGYFKDLNVQWQDFAGGTGAMNKALRDGSLDIAILLTEGIAADIINGNPSQILQTYIKSPLIWGLHTSATRDFEKMSDLKKAKYAISRLGSGSHLMAYINAQNQNWQLTENDFTVVGNFDTARQSLHASQTDVILWEKFTTKPYVDSGELKRVGECVTPWSCFVIAARNEIIETRSAELHQILRTINNACYEFMDSPQAISLVAERYGLLYRDAELWFYQTEWSSDNHISEKMLNNVMNNLLSIGAIKSLVNPHTLCSTSHTNFVTDKPQKTW